ncbi:MAG: hypothetical protein ISP82_02870 [Candidatus Poseidoniaceae archaeon]|nr:hypothetical protein [Candidatus Poseidoniaceae archaeon]MBL6896253.1 hypothetical protein [Candidatus Poseidoniaceae archaeon]
MAEDVQVQSDVTITGSAKARTLHLKTLRKQWQIITLQIIATAALIGMYLEVVSTYVVGTIDHTILFSSIESLIGSDLPLGKWFTGQGRTGLARFFVPLAIGLLVGGLMALVAYQTPKTQQRLKLGFIITLITLLVGRLILGWLTGMIFSFDIRLPDDGELQTLEWPLLMIMSLLIMFVYLLPIIMGSRGIWGLSKKSIAWAIGFTLLFLGIHAILTFPLIKSQLGDYGGALATLESQISQPTIGLFGIKLVTSEQFDLILIAVLILVFQESAFGVIKYLEYAFRLPESCKRDPEYVNQMDNILNTHLMHTFGFLGLTGIATMVALGFHSVLLSLVSDTTGSQWAGQVSESIELSLTYGLVISAVMFLSFMALLRYLIPWQRIWGFTYSLRNNNPSENEKPEKEFIEF